MVNRWRLDNGVSLVEVVVAMFVLALLSLALIPALIASIKQSATNALLSSATQIVSARLDEARVQSATCSALTALAAANVPDVRDSSGISLHVNQQLGACPATYPGTVAITVSVIRTDTSAQLVSASTLVFLQSAN
jgi:prepilin-type N-terminal cleavage/methylation domain-containing protein